MLKHLLKKFLILAASLWVVATLTFVLIHVVPGNPFAEEQTSQEIIETLYRYYGFDQPLWDQYIIYLKNLLQGDLGQSLKYIGRSSVSIISDGFPISLTLGMEALFISIGLGLTLGSISALKRGSWQDRCIMIGAVLGISVPSFILATILQYLFAMQLDWFPVARWGTFQQSVLPALSLAVFPTAIVARLTQTSMVEVLQQDYILTAKAKGLSTFQIITRHAIRNTILPVVSYIGPLIANVLTGSFVVEKIFGIPGLGQWFVMSVSNRDYSLIMALTMFYSTFLMLTVFIVDVIYAWIDPRIKKVGRA